ncbi:MAG: hypothetical protein LBN05_07550 [Oscillospiraceae bacterium]|jgi:hypothetical protein|nr:hypothetical protein [Oscillospiraceae bacterium]
MKKFLRKLPRRTLSIVLSVLMVLSAVAVVVPLMALSVVAAVADGDTNSNAWATAADDVEKIVWLHETLPGAAANQYANNWFQAAGTYAAAQYFNYNPSKNVYDTTVFNGGAHGSPNDNATSMAKSEDGLEANETALMNTAKSRLTGDRGVLTFSKSVAEQTRLKNYRPQITNMGNLKDEVVVSASFTVTGAEGAWTERWDSTSGNDTVKNAQGYAWVYMSAKSALTQTKTGVIPKAMHVYDDYFVPAILDRSPVGETLETIQGWLDEARAVINTFEATSGIDLDWAYGIIGEKKGKVDAYIDLLEFTLTLPQYVEMAEWFQGPAVGQTVVINENLNQTNYNRPAGYEPRTFENDVAYYYGDDASAKYTLAELEALHLLAVSKLAQLRAIESKLTQWSVLVATAALGGVNIDLDWDQVWIDNLYKTVVQFKLHNMLDEAKLLIAESDNPHEGVADNLNPDDPAEPFVDSDYRLSTQRVVTIKEILSGDIDALNAYRAQSLDAIVDAIFAGDYTQTKLTERRDLLNHEYGYRVELGFSEEVWYSYRDFFTPMSARNWATTKPADAIALYLSEEEHGNAPKPAYKGYQKNVIAYNALKAQAQAALSAQEFGEIYGAYSEDVIIPTENIILNGIALSLTSYVYTGMQIIANLEEANKIHIAGDTIDVISWATFAQLEEVIKTIDVGVYEFLKDTSNLWRLGTADPAYTATETETDYLWLINVVLKKINDFKDHPENYYVSTDLEAPERPATANDFAPGHNYTATDDKMLTVLNKLDTFLSTGDLNSLPLDALGLDLNSILGGLGAAPSGALNVPSILQAVLEGMLLNNDTINMIVGMVYPMVLPQFEKEFKNIAQPSMLDGMGDGQIVEITLRPLHDLFGNSALKGLRWTQNNGQLNGAPPADFTLPNNTLSDLRLYPDLMADALDPVKFASAYNALKKTYSDHPELSTPITIMNSNPPIYNGYFYDLDVWHDANIFDSKLGRDARGNPILNADGVAEGTYTIDWGLDGLTGTELRTRFVDALGAALGGLLPLLRTIFAGVSYQGFHDNIGEAHGYASDSQASNPIPLNLGPSRGGNSGNLAQEGFDGQAGNITMSGIYLNLTIPPIKGYQTLLTPIFETLAGTDSAILDKIPAITTLATNTDYGKPTTAPVLNRRIGANGASGSTGQNESSSGNETRKAVVSVAIIGEVASATSHQGIASYYRYATNPNYTYPKTSLAVGATPLVTETAVTKASRNLVAAIFDPIFAYVDKLGAAPLSVIEELLPNLFYALSFNKIAGALEGLDLSINIDADGWLRLGYLHANAHNQVVLNLPDGTLKEGIKLYIDGTGCAKDTTANIAVEALVKEIKPVEMPLSGIIADALPGGIPSSVADLMALLPLGDIGDVLPPFNPGRIMTYGGAQPGPGGLKSLASKDLDGTRHYIVADKPDVTHAMLGSILSKFAPAMNTPEGLAAIVELIVPQAYANIPVNFTDPTFNTVSYPDWWAGADTAQDPEKEAGAIADGQYILDNANGILDLAWQIFFQKSGTFGDGLKAIINDLALGTISFSELVDQIQGFLTEGELAATLDSFSSLLSSAIVIGGQTVDVAAIIDGLKNYDASAVTVTNLEELVDALIDLLAPLGPVFDFIFSGKDLEILDIDAGNGSETLVKALGYNGYADGLFYILEALAKPLGVAVTAPAAYAALGTNYAGKLHAILDPILGVLQQVETDPVGSVLDLVPNLLYFISKPANEADGTSSPLELALNGAFHSIFVLLDTLAPLFNVSDLLADISLPEGISLIGGVKLDVQALIGELPFELSKLLVGVLDTNDRTVITDRVGLLFAILKEVGALAFVTDNGYEALTYLIQYEKFPNPELVDYAVAAAAVNVNRADHAWLTDTELNYIRANADGVINWAWDYLLYSNPAGKPWLEDIVNGAIGGGFELKATLSETVQALFGNDFLVKDNLDLIVDIVKGLKATLDGIEIPAIKVEALGLESDSSLTLTSLIKKLLTVGGEGVDLDAIFAPFVAYDPATVTIDNQAQFKAKLYELLSPAVPLLLFFLTGKDIKVIDDAGVNNGNGFITAFGYEGYKNGLLPILAGLGADIDGYLATIMDYDTFADSATTNTQRLEAIVEPILFFLNKLTSAPTDTLLHTLPNLLYLISDANGDSILSQSVNNLVYTISVLAPYIAPLQSIWEGTVAPILESIGGLNATVADLLGGFLDADVAQFIVGTVTEYDASLKSIGKANNASYVKVDLNGLLVQVLDLLGALDIIEENGLTGLVYLLQPGDPAKPGPIVYPALNNGDPGGERNEWWTKAHETYVIDRADDFVNKLWTVLFGVPFGSLDLEGATDGAASEASTFLTNLLGSAVYTQDNFDMIVGGLQGVIPELANSEVLPGRTLGDILAEAVTVGNKHIDVLTILNKLAAWKQTAPVDNQNGFVTQLVSFLAPLMPILDFVLAGEDLRILQGRSDIDNGKGFVKAFGYDGYQYGLIPIYEALLKPLGKESAILTKDQWVNLPTDEQRLQAVLDPILLAVEQLLTDPVNTLLTLLPNIAYFINDANGDSLLQQSLDRILFSINTVVEEALLTDTLQGAIGQWPIKISVSAILEDLIGGLNLPISAAGVIEGLIIGELKDYTSASGAPAKYIVSKDNGDRGAVLTAILRIAINAVVTEENRLKVLDLLVNTLNLSGTAYAVVNQTLKDILVFFKQGGTTQWGNKVYGADIVLNLVFVLAYGADKVVCSFYDNWQNVNAVVRTTYEKLLASNKYDSSFAQHAQAFTDRYIKEIFTPKEGFAQFGFISFFQNIFAWFKKIFGYFFG